MPLTCYGFEVELGRGSQRPLRSLLKWTRGETLGLGADGALWYEALSLVPILTQTPSTLRMTVIFSSLKSNQISAEVPQTADGLRTTSIRKSILNP